MQYWTGECNIETLKMTAVKWGTKKHELCPEIKQKWRRAVSAPKSYMNKSQHLVPESTTMKTYPGILFVYFDDDKNKNIAKLLLIVWTNFWKQNLAFQFKGTTLMTFNNKHNTKGRLFFSVYVSVNGRLRCLF